MGAALIHTDRGGDEETNRQTDGLVKKGKGRFWVLQH